MLAILTPHMNWKRHFMRTLRQRKLAFSLIEIIIVMGLVAMITTLALRGVVNSQKSFIFASTYQRVQELVRQARSLAVTAKAQLDFTDYDNDDCTHIASNANPDICTAPDFVTPAHYGVFFDPINYKVILFADLHDPDNLNKEGVYVAGALLNTYQPNKDLNLAEFTLPEGYGFVIPTGRTIFYTPVFADTSFDFNPLPQTFYIFGIQDEVNNMKRCSKIHPVAGVPEVALNSECTNI